MKRHLSGWRGGTVATFACVLLLSGCPSHPGRSLKLPVTDPARASFPDPLVFENGRPVRTRNQWIKQRRPELKRLFQDYMYGQLPPEPAHETFHLDAEYPVALNGKATLKLVTIGTGPETNAPRIELMLFLPKGSSEPVPVFLAMNFCGNQALTTDTRVPLSLSWAGKNCAGCISNKVTELSRGSQETNWPLEEIISRGYGIASFDSADIDADTPESSTGVYAWLAETGHGANHSTNRGTIAAWAWGFSRCVDYLQTDGQVARDRIAVLGHSRNGKAALLAAAFDERIAMAFPHQAGMGGSAPSRSTQGESVRAINDRFPHWFNAKFKEFNDAPEKLPIDQNCLLALCAPRPVMFSTADADQWSNPPGQLEILKATTPVYKFLGTKGLEPATRLANAPVQIGKPPGRLAFFMRPGKHSLTVEDWRAFLDFADAQWAKASDNARH